MNEKILHAAVKTVEGWPIFGKCHADCFHKAAQMKIPMSSKADDQGFLTSTGRYVMRGEAYNIARAANQIDESQIDTDLDPELFNLGKDAEDAVTKKIQRLFSEDLWSNVYRGKHDYDHIKGYVLKGTNEATKI